MGDFDLDRESFVTRIKDEQPQPQRRFPMAGALIVLAVAALVGFAAYKMQGNGTVSKLLETSGVAALANHDSDVPQIMQRLDEIEQRLNQLEKHRKGEPATTAGMVSSKQMNSHPEAAAAPVAAEAASHPEPQVAASAQPKPSIDASASQREAGSKVDQGAQEQWQAAADRLGNVVGELAAQRDEIERNRAIIGQLSERVGSQKTTQPFTLKKGDKTQRVGPVWLALQSTDPTNHRYTLNLLVDNKPVELKDRALHETIQFTPASGGAPFELVVSEIRKDGVSGRLALPRNN
jgi:hypothetical protein